MTLETLQQIGMLHQLCGERSNFDAQMQYWEEIADGPVARLVRGAWHFATKIAAWRPAHRAAVRPAHS